MRRGLLVALAALLLAACAGPGGRGAAPCVALAPGASVCLLAPAVLPQLELRHLVQLEHENRHETFIGQVRVDARALHLAAVSPFGAHLFSVRWDGVTATLTPPRTPLRPELLVALLQLALADPAALRPQLRGMTLRVDAGERGTEVRELRRGEALLGRIVRRGDLAADGRLDVLLERSQLRLRLTPLEGGT